MIIKTRISNRAEKKTNIGLRNLIFSLKKQKNLFWLRVAQLLARPRKKKVIVNFERLNKLTKANETILIPGKLLAYGNLEHSLTIASFSTSAKAKTQKNAKIVGIEQMVKLNPSGKGIRIII